MTGSARYREFHDACWNDPARARAMLASDPTLLDVRSRLGETVLHDSAIENGLEAVRFLLAHGAAPDPRNNFGNSPLQECASICRAEWDLTAILDLLLRAGADPYHTTKLNVCAWHTAQRSTFPALRALFASVPSPPAPHETCEFLASIPTNPIWTPPPESA